MYAFWTPERTEELKTLKTEGHNAQEISDRLGHTTKGAVLSKIHALHLTSKYESNWTPERVEKLTRLWLDGHSAYKISLRFEPGLFTRSAVISKVCRLGLERGATTQAIVLNRSSQVTLHQHRIRRGELGTRALDKDTIFDMSSLRQQTGKCDVKIQPSDPQPHERVKTEDLKRHHCRWPLGNGDDFGHCGRQRDGERPYCEEHSARAFLPTEPLVY